MVGGANRHKDALSASSAENKTLINKPHYFDDSAPEKGRCWAIIFDDKPLGMISWGEIDFESKRTGLDIVIGSSENCGMGFGSDGLKTLVKFLFEEVILSEVYIGAHIKNPRAINAYKKAGFEQIEIKEEIRKDRFIEDYNEGKV